VGIKFGMWSTILLVGSAHGVVVALLLARVRRNRVPNRLLAVLLLLVSLLITPYTLGYAGFYDAYPWLSFAPFDWRLAFGPLLFLYVRQLGTLALPRRWAWHFAPALLQGSYYLIVFCQPLAFKNRWDDYPHVPWVVPLETWATHASLSGYLVAAYRRYNQVQRWLEQNSAAREEYRWPWLRGFLLALTATTFVSIGFDLFPLFGHRLNYYERFPLYLAFTTLVYYLGIEGWRHAAQLFPSNGALDTFPAAATPEERALPAVALADPSDLTLPQELLASARPPQGEFLSAEPRQAALRQSELDRAELDRGESRPLDPHRSLAVGPTPASPSVAELATTAGAAPPDHTVTTERNWAESGQEWAARVAAEGWWREPELSLTELARRLRTNPRYLSRALNEGLGISFSEFINRQRVDEAKRRLRGDGEVLAIALEVGFSSKASFNRAFKAFTGCTPSEYRNRRGSLRPPT
jgi:AraC-like DNA-binding protein